MRLAERAANLKCRLAYIVIAARYGGGALRNRRGLSSSFAISISRRARRAV
jgi:hypothetical protein